MFDEKEEVKNIYLVRKEKIARSAVVLGDLLNILLQRRHWCEKLHGS